MPRGAIRSREVDPHLKMSLTATRKSQDPPGSMPDFEVLRSSRVRPSPLVVHTDELFTPAALAQGGTVFVSNLPRPAAAAFENEVSAQLARFGRCLIVDARSIQSRAGHPDLCLGYDGYHASEPLLTALEHAAGAAGWSVARNTPFAGSYVPLVYYRKDPRVVSVMIAMNRARSMDEGTGRRSAVFDAARELAGELVATAVLFEAFRNTFFRAQTPGGDLCIRVGDRCLGLDALLAAEGHETWAYVTA